MSYIQFESGREKEKARQELREAREQLLEKAKANAQHRAERSAQKKLSGETNWMLPSIADKLEKISKSTAKKSKSSHARKKLKKEKKNKKRKQKSSSGSETESNSSNSSCSRKKSKKSKKKRSHKNREYSSDSDDNVRDSEQEDQWIEKSSTIQPVTATTAQQRDSWMTDTLMLKTFSRERTENKPNEKKQQIDGYDPAKSTRELNPYWQSTGTGLPAFKKPKNDSSGDEATLKVQQERFSESSSTKRNWQKKTSHNQDVDSLQHKRIRSHTPTIESESSSQSEPEAESVDQQKHKEVHRVDNSNSQKNFLTDQQMNELGAKILKAEIMGNTQLAEDLKNKLAEARTNRAAIKERIKEQVSKQPRETIKLKQNDEDEHVLLTRTDKQGNSRPLAQSKTIDPRDLYGGKSASRKKTQKRVETHVGGERVRYFADDDRYNLKQMFEREKYTTAAEANLQFADIASKHKNPNDDLEDIFADKVRKNISQSETDQKELHRAIHEQQQLQQQLDKCDKCFDSTKMDKKLLVSMGEKCYLALPWHTGLQTGHCVLVPTQHVSCCTQLDEDTWEEIQNFRKALTRMFAAQRKDVIFYEVANKLHRHLHLSIHCVPIGETHAEMAPFYFKKAIEESEHEWSVNKQLVSLRNKGLRSCIPKGLPYFWVNFGMDSGFAHVIEDQERFPSNFAKEIIGGMLHLEASKWRKPQKEHNIIAKVKMFADWWKKYDCTE